MLERYKGLDECKASGSTIVPEQKEQPLRDEVSSIGGLFSEFFQIFGHGSLVSINFWDFKSIQLCFTSALLSSRRQWLELAIKFGSTAGLMGFNSVKGPDGNINHLIASGLSMASLCLTSTSGCYESFTF